jgi:hypothetical protein
MGIFAPSKIQRYYMKKFILSVSILFALNTQAQTIIDTVSTGAGYANQIWYSLKNDNVKSESKDDWDLGIELSGFNSSILVNTQKAGVAVYQSPYDWTQWSTFDTANYKNWPALHNSDSMWDIGALNKPGTYNTADLGWGSYDPNTHVISGTRLYLLTLPGNKFIKLGVKSLIGGVYTITYINVDQTDSTTFTITKSNYPERNFIYYAIGTKTILDREPSNSTWDLTFTKYIYNNYPLGGGQFMPYPVTGILLNKSVKATEVRHVDIATTNNYKGRTYTSNISEIGSDWKTFNMMSGTYSVTDSLVYFVQDIEGNFWKLVMTGFSGSTAGNYMLSKQQLSNVSVSSFDANNHVYVYPNPVAQGNNITLITDLNGHNASSLTITDINGKVVFMDKNPAQNGLNAIDIPFNFEKGVYFISLQTSEGTITKKLLSL